MCGDIHLRMTKFLRECVYEGTCTCVYMWGHAHMCMCGDMCVCVGTCTCVYMWAHAHVCMCGDVHICVYVGTCTCVYMWAHPHMCMCGDMHTGPSSTSLKPFEMRQHEHMWGYWQLSYGAFDMHKYMYMYIHIYIYMSIWMRTYMNLLAPSVSILRVCVCTSSCIHMRRSAYVCISRSSVTTQTHTHTIYIH